LSFASDDKQSGCPARNAASGASKNKYVHADELADLLRWCAALSTDPADLAGAVVLAAGPRWSRLVDSPPDLRELTVRTFLHTAEPADPIPRAGLERIPAELRDIVLSYDRLPRLQRAAIMLSCLEGVTYAEIAGTLDRSVARIGIEVDQALAAINTDSYAVRAALDIASWQVPDFAAVSRALAGRTRGGRRGASALCRAAAIRGMDVHPHRSTDARLVRPKPNRRTGLGNHDAARRAAQ
jgi:hypothetical protein